MAKRDMHLPCAAPVGVQVERDRIPSSTLEAVPRWPRKSGAGRWKSICRSLRFILPLFVWMGCAQGVQRPEGPGIVVGLEGNPVSLDPRFATDAYSEQILPLLFNGLLRLDEGQNFRGDLAEAWWMEGPRTHLFRIRKGVRFHDGHELTARDVQYTFDFIRDPRNLCPIYSSYRPIDRIECLDFYTVRFQLKEPYASFPYQMTRGIVPARWGNRREFQERPIGSGPFRFVHWRKGEQILLKRNDEVLPPPSTFLHPLPTGPTSPTRSDSNDSRIVRTGHDASPSGRPRLSWILFSVIPHTTTRLLEMKKGGVDLLQNSIPPYAVRYFERMDGIDVRVEPGINYRYMGFNLRDPILGRREVRQAIAHAVDRDSIIRFNLKGLARKAVGILAPSHWAFEERVQRYEYDPARAKALLDKAGFPDPDGEGPLPRFKLSLKTSTNRESNEIAQVIAKQLGQVGIAVEKRGYEWGTFYGDIQKGNFQVYTLSWVGILDPDIFYYLFHSEMVPPKGANRGHYRNPQLDLLIERSRRTLDTEVRRRIYSEIQRILADDAVYTSLWYTHNVVAIRDRYRGFRMYPGGDYTSLKDVTVAERP